MKNVIAVIKPRKLEPLRAALAALGAAGAMIFAALPAFAQEAVEKAA
ncbi:MAG: hypothetical protein JHD10_08750, partial [Sphingomonadaceae bacterium]|nr:hypothetical protein [Sphingomonadaceae bacterium]MBJ7527312.1 hypothetical protein [Sphingomonadaceae bacterium]